MSDQEAKQAVTEIDGLNSIATPGQSLLRPTMANLVSLSQRRGFFFQSSSIYGGMKAVWDYGPLGSRFKQNIRDTWIRSMTQWRDDIDLVDSAILMRPEVWEASGHAATFADPLVDCTTCQGRFRADHLSAASCGRHPNQTPGATKICSLTPPRQFNLMFETQVGAEGKAWLRPETAQGIFTNYAAVQASQGRQIPFGIAQVGKAFRNEITPGNFLFRLREFEQMEMQFFVDPKTSHDWYEYWRQARLAWHLSMGLGTDRLAQAPHKDEDLAHYAKAASDINYDFGDSLGFQELEGVHHRGSFDLSNHQAASGKPQRYIDRHNANRYTPEVIETSVGLDRLTLATMANAWRFEWLPETSMHRLVLKLPPILAPFPVSVMSISKKHGQPELAENFSQTLRQKMPVQLDISGAIGKAYRRADEIGTPWCIAIDAQSVIDQTATIRDRDTTQQIRLPLSDIPNWITTQLAQEEQKIASSLNIGRPTKPSIALKR